MSERLKNRGLNCWLFQVENGYRQKGISERKNWVLQIGSTQRLRGCGEAFVSVVFIAQQWTIQQRHPISIDLSKCSPGLVVMEEDSCSRGREFVLQHWILDWQFLH